MALKQIESYFCIDWRRGTHKDEERHLIALFADNENAPFSIHNFVQHGASACGKRPGEWFGPSATARCIKYVFFPITLLIAYPS